MRVLRTQQLPPLPLFCRARSSALTRCCLALRSWRRGARAASARRRARRRGRCAWVLRARRRQPWRQHCVGPAMLLGAFQRSAQVCLRCLPHAAAAAGGQGRRGGGREEEAQGRRGRQPGGQRGGEARQEEEKVGARGGGGGSSKRASGGGGSGASQAVDCGAGALGGPDGGGGRAAAAGGGRRGVRGAQQRADQPCGVAAPLGLPGSARVGSQEEG